MLFGICPTVILDCVCVSYARTSVCVRKKWTIFDEMLQPYTLYWPSCGNCTEVISWYSLFVTNKWMKSTTFFSKYIFFLFHYSSYMYHNPPLKRLNSLLITNISIQKTKCFINHHSELSIVKYVLDDMEFGKYNMYKKKTLLSIL